MLLADLCTSLAAERHHLGASILGRTHIRLKLLKLLELGVSSVSSIAESTPGNYFMVHIIAHTLIFTNSFGSKGVNEMVYAWA